MIGVRKNRAWFCVDREERAEGGDDDGNPSEPEPPPDHHCDAQHDGKVRPHRSADPPLANPLGNGGVHCRRKGRRVPDRAVGYCQPLGTGTGARRSPTRNPLYGALPSDRNP